MSIAQTLILLGGGGHAAVVTESARAAGFVVLGYLDDKDAPDQSALIAGFKRLGAISDLPSMMRDYRHAFFHAAVGDPTLRRTWLDLPAPRGTPAIIHPSAIVSASAKIAEGAFIGPRAVINARASIGRGVIVNTGAIIEHDCVLEPFCHAAPGSVLAGAVAVGEDSLIGANAACIPGIRIGKRATLGAGGVAVTDIPDGATAIGVPARIMEAQLA
jgi:sugar O-acyltransferase (sialic acid O-acetyltransferase NeuD family)